MDKKYILFDLDGTLTDPALGITNSIMYSLKSFGIEVSNRKDLYVFIGPPLHQQFMDYCHFSSEEADKAVAKYREYFSVTGLFENDPYPHINEVLASLKNKGYKIALATSKPEIYAKQILEKFDMAQYFDIIKGSRLNDKTENKTRIMKEAMDFFNDDDLSKYVMVGDRKFDMLGAKELGIDSIGVTYGYGSRQELEESQATIIIDDCIQLNDIFK